MRIDIEPSLDEHEDSPPAKEWDSLREVLAHVLANSIFCLIFALEFTFGVLILAGILWIVKKVSGHDTPDLVNTTMAVIKYSVFLIFVVFVSLNSLRLLMAWWNKDKAKETKKTA